MNLLLDMMYLPFRLTDSLVKHVLPVKHSTVNADVKTCEKAEDNQEGNDKVTEVAEKVSHAFT